MLRVVSAAAVFFMSLALVGLATGLGARYPRFNADNPSQVAGSYGGVAFMILAVLFMIVLIVLVGWPSSVFLWYSTTHLPVPARVVLLGGGAFASAILLSLSTWWFGMRSGVNASSRWDKKICLLKRCCFSSSALSRPRCRRLGRRDGVSRVLLDARSEGDRSRRRPDHGRADAAQPERVHRLNRRDSPSSAGSICTGALPATSIPAERQRAAMVFGTGGIAGTIALILGGAVVGRNAKKMAALGPASRQRRRAPDGRPSSPR
jgi:hypothetical protein